MACSQNRVTLLTGIDHDGFIDENGPTVSESSVTVLPLSTLPATARFTDWTLMGGVDALDAGSVFVRLDQPLCDGQTVRLAVDAASLDVFLFRYDEHVWQGQGAGSPWVLPASTLDSGNRLKLGLVVRELDAARLAAGRPRCNRFTLAAELLDVDGSVLGSDAIDCRIAPFQLASSLDPVEQVLVVQNQLTKDFVPRLEAILAEIGVPLQIIEPDNVALSDVWMQDTVEIGRYVVPGAAGPQQAVGLLTGLRAKHDGIDCKPLDRAARTHFEQANAVIIQAEPRPHTRWIDWFGNLEVSPPVTTRDGRHFRCGRVLVGKQRELEMHPDILRFLEAQGIQTPAVTVDTSWLEVGHVDEVVNFAPAPDEPGFRLLIPSPARARSILAELAQRKPETPIFAGTDAETTAEALLDEIANAGENQTIQQTLDRTRRMLCEELGIDDDDFIEIPALFREGQAVIPNCVNCLVVNQHVILPDPKGPTVDGMDAFATSMRVALEALGLTVHFIDNWAPYHVRAGEVHCGTNAVRRVGTECWWQV